MSVDLNERYEFYKNSMLNPDAHMKGLNEAGFLDSFTNLMTGNLDFERSVNLQNITNAFNAREAVKDREFQLFMSNTAYQRAVEDMRKAGLNPYLLYGSGKSMQSSTPAGAQASSPPASVFSSNNSGWKMLTNLLLAGLNVYAGMNSANNSKGNNRNNLSKYKRKS